MLVVTTWLPTREKPEVGAFVARDIALLSRDHEVHVLHLAAEGASLPVEGATLTTVRMSPARPASVLRAARVIREMEPSFDVVHTMAVSALLPFVASRPRRPWVHTEHWSALLAPETVGRVPRLAIPLIASLLRRPDLVVAVGSRLATAIRAHRTRPTVVIPNAVPAPEALQERPAGDRPRLVAVGGLIARKGPDVAIEAVAELHRRGLPVRLVWAGEGPMRDELTVLARRLGVADDVELRGRVAPDAVGRILDEGDAFLLPTTMETFGVAIAEALVAGRPVVVGADGEQESFVSEPDGILVHEQSPAAYASAVQRVLELNAGRSAAEIAQRTRARFDEELRRREYTAAYERAGGAGTADPDVDVVIAVHDPRRRVDRAVSSALTSNAVARVIVVCHGVDPEAVEAVVAADDPRVEFVRFDDGVRSPAGPFNRGLELATSRFVSIMGSDDEVTPGAVDAWRRTAERDGADAVIAALRHATGARVPTPPTPRIRRLRGARDRLAYRTAPLGLVARARLDGLRMTAGLATGEDLAFTARLWFGTANVSRHTGPGDYLIHDGDDRVTFTPRALADELRAVQMLIADPWVDGLRATDRLALAVKLWRISVFGAVHYRAGRWTAADRDWVVGLVGELRRFAPQAEARLSRADAALVRALADSTVPDGTVDALSQSRRHFASARALLPSRITMVLAREAPVRFMVATWLAGRR